MTKRIELTQGKVAIVDDEDYDKCMKYKWCVNRIGGHYYVIATERKVRPQMIIRMHRLITNAPAGMVVDHIDGNPLNNTRANLRICTHKENLRNRKRSKNNTSGYNGVTWDKQPRKWAAQIVVNKKLVSLGRFSDKEEAARAYDVAARKYFGEFARLNFPDR